MKGFLEKRMNHKTLLWGLLGALWVLGAAAWAQHIAVHPLEVEGLDSERWNALFMREVAKQKVKVMPEAMVEAFLQSHGGSCRGDIKCLRTLGYATEVSHVLEGKVSKREVLITSGHMVQADGMQRQTKVLELTKAYFASARVLHVDGTVLKEVGPLEVAPVSETDEEANARAVYSKLLEALKLERLPSPPERVLTPPPLPPEAPVPPLVFDTRLRTASYALLGVSGAAIVATITSWYRYERDLLTSENFAIAFGAVAGITCIAGLMLFLIPPRYVQQPVNLGLMPTQGGALLSFQGRFP